MNFVQKNWLSSFEDTTRQTPSRKSQYEQARAEKYIAMVKWPDDE